MANYGIPYMGNKDSLMGKIGQIFPKAENFYDLFGGGFSVTHFMLWNYGKNYKRFFYNDVQPLVVKLVQDAIAGKFNYNVFKPEFIDRDTFNKNKDLCGYIRVIWSFGNNNKGYMFGKDIEPYKKALHNAVVFGDFNELAKKTLRIDKWPAHLSIKGRRLACKKIVNNRIDTQQLEQLERLQQLEQLERLQQLEQLEQLERLVTFSSKSYDQIQILPNSVIYCDPPYKDTASYGEQSFDHDKFWAWVEKSPHPIFVSEYSAPKFMNVVAAFNHKKKLSSKGCSTDSVEYLYANNPGKKLIG
jgi:site-specific DNA-adenine methylase